MTSGGILAKARRSDEGIVAVNRAVVELVVTATRAAILRNQVSCRAKMMPAAAEMFMVQ